MKRENLSPQTKSKLRPQRSISTQWISMVLAVGLIATVVTTYIQVQVEKRRELKSIDHSRAVIRESFLAPLARNLWDLEDERIEFLLVGLSHLPLVEQVELDGVDVAHIYQAGEVKSAFTRVEEFPLSYTPPKRKDASSLSLGVLRVTFGLDPIEKKGRWLGFVLFFGQLVQMFLICLSLYVAFHYLVGRHLTTIAHFVSNLSVKKFGGRLRLERKQRHRDEFSLVVSSLNMLVEKVAHYTQNLEKIVEEKKRNVSTLFGHIQQGIFLIGPDLKLAPDYSDYLEVMLERTHLQGVSVLDLLFGQSQLTREEISSIMTALMNSIGNTKSHFLNYSARFPRELTFTTPSGVEKFLEIDWTPVVDLAEQVNSMMVSLRDVTALRGLANLAGKKQAEMKVIDEILGVGLDKFNEFYDYAKEVLKLALADRPEDVTPRNDWNKKVRNITTLKSVVEAMNFTGILAALTQCEVVLSTSHLPREGSLAAADRQRVKKALGQVHGALDTYRKICDSKLGQPNHLRSEGGALGAQYKGEDGVWLAQKELTQLVTSLRHLKRSEAIKDFEKTRLEQLIETFHLAGCLTLKEIVEEILGSLEVKTWEMGKVKPKVLYHLPPLYIRPAAQRAISSTLKHFLENSLEHGLEGRDERRHLGKERVGKIEIWGQVRENHLILKYWDDGRGLNLKEIHQKALKLKLIDAQTPLTFSAVAPLILLPGVSTHSHSEKNRGQGVGLDGTSKYLESLDGQLEVLPQKLESTQVASLSHHVSFQLIVKIPLGSDFVYQKKKVKTLDSSS